MLILLMNCNVFNCSVDLTEQIVIGNHASLVSLREYVLVIVSKLLTANSTDQVGRARLGLLYLSWAFLSWGELG